MGDDKEIPAHGDETHSCLLEKDKNDIELVSNSDSFVKQYCMEVKIILHVVNGNERLATFNKMEPISRKLEGGTESLKYLKFFVNYKGLDRSAVYTLGVFGGYKTALVQTAPGIDCRPKIESAIDQFPNAAWIIGVGVAYGRDREKQKLGDVLVSEKIEMMDTVKFNNQDEMNNRGERLKIADHLFTHFCMECEKFSKFPCTKVRLSEESASTKDSLRYSKVHVGIIVSGSFLLNNKEIKKKVLANAKEAIGGEMEGHVLMTITKERNPRRVEPIIIKGVCDYGDGTKEESWQLTAALAAVEYAHLRLKETKGFLFQTEGEKDKNPAVTEQPTQPLHTSEQKHVNMTDGSINTVQNENVDMTDGNTSTAQNETEKDTNSAVFPQPTQPPQTSQQIDNGKQALGEDDLADVLVEVVDLTARWKAFGIALKLRNADLEAIAVKNHHNPTDCLKDTLLNWLQGHNNTEGPPSWELLCKAVKARIGGDNPALANRIEKKHLKK